MENKNDNLIRITGLWEKVGKIGAYFQGQLSPSVNILIFKNQYKSSVQDPDYILYLAPPGKRKESEDPEDDIEPF